VSALGTVRANPTSEQLPPQNQDAERSVLGACLLHCDVVPVVAARLKPGDFYLRRHELIFAAIPSTPEAKGGGGHS
jgi:replicative DNA helicase